MIRMIGLRNRRELLRMMTGVVAAAVGGCAGHAWPDWYVQRRKESEQFLVRTFACDEMAYCVGFSPDSRRVAAGTFSNMVQCWDIGTGGSVYSHRHGRTPDHRVVCVSFSADGGSVTSWSSDGSGRRWNIAEDAARWELDVSRFGEPMAYSEVSSVLAVKQEDGHVILLRIPEATVIASMNPERRMEPVIGAFSPDGRRLAVGHGNLNEPNQVTVYNAATGQVLKRIADQRLSFFPNLDRCKFSPDGSRFATDSGGGCVLVWDTATWTLLAVFDGLNGTPHDLAFSPDARRLLFSPNVGQAHIVYDIQTRQVLREYYGNDGEVTAVAWAPDGRLLATGSFDRHIRIWRWPAD